MKPSITEPLKEIFFKNNIQNYLERISNCFCCGGKDFHFLFTKAKFNHYICQKCNFVFVNPRPDKDGIYKLYNCASYRKEQEDLCAENKSNKYYSTAVNTLSWMNEIANIIYKYKKEGSILDVGCGSGAFLRFLKAKRFKFDFYGTELSEIYYKHYEFSNGITFLKEDLNYLINNKMKFDIITLLAVIEHVQNPSNLLNQIKKLLKKNGILFLMFPTFSLLSRKLLKELHHNTSAPYHINFFNKKSIKALLKRTGNLSLIKYYEDKGVFSFNNLIRKFSIHQNFDLKNYMIFTKGFFKRLLFSYPKLLKFMLLLTNLIDKLLNRLIQKLDGADIGNAIIVKND